MRTSSMTVNADRGEPVVANEVAGRPAVRDVPACVWVDVELGEAEVDHVQRFLIRLQAHHAVAQLDISM